MTVPDTRFMTSSLMCQTGVHGEHLLKQLTATRHSVGPDVLDLVTQRPAVLYRFPFRHSCIVEDDNITDFSHASKWVRTWRSEDIGLNISVLLQLTVMLLHSVYMSDGSKTTVKQPCVSC